MGTWFRNFYSALQHTIIGLDLVEVFQTQLNSVHSVRNQCRSSGSMTFYVLLLALLLHHAVVSVSEDARYTLFLAYDITPLAGNTDFPCDFQRCSSD